MTKVKILVVEDKSIVAKDIATSLEELGYEVTAVVDKGEAALSSILQNRPDLVLLDINIKGDMDGIQVASHVSDQFPIPVIYLTAYSDSNTLQRAMKTHPYAYIVKPFDEKDLQIAIDLAISNYSFHSDNKLTSQSFENYVVKESVFIKKDNRYHKILLHDILFVEASGSYVDIYAENKKYTLSINLHHFEKQVANSELVRVHRSYMVNLTKVDSFEHTRLFLENKTIPISKMYRDTVLARFRQI